MAVAAEPRHLRFAVIGAGMAGILSAIKLTEAGYTDFTVYEKADRPGGTWRENTYPGLACDVPSHLYCYSFALNAGLDAPLFARARDPGLLRAGRPGPRSGRGTPASATRSSAASSPTAAGTSRQRRATTTRWTWSSPRPGVLHHPHVPATSRDSATSRARAFHSSRWDHDVAIGGARVGVVGTGSTAVQIVGAIVDEVAQLSLFQRTAQWIMPQENPAYSDEERAGFRDDPTQLHGLHDKLCEQFDVFANAIVHADSPEMQLVERLCREHLEGAVHDPVLRERLRPSYRAACKRLVVSGQFYDAIQRPNAELVTEPIERIEARGVRTRDGRAARARRPRARHGFPGPRVHAPTAGRGARRAHAHRRVEQRPSAYLSISIPGLPELLHAERPERPGRQLLAHRRRRAAVRLRPPARGPARVRRVPGGQPDRGGDRRFEAERTEAAKGTIWRRAVAAGTSTTGACPRCGRSRSTASVPRWPAPTSRPTTCADLSRRAGPPGRAAASRRAVAGTSGARPSAGQGSSPGVGHSRARAGG